MNAANKAKRTAYSASQVETFQRCPRAWYNKSVLKHPDPSSPQAERGTRIHKFGELYQTIQAIALEEAFDTADVKEQFFESLRVETDAWRKPPAGLPEMVWRFYEEEELPVGDLDAPIIRALVNVLPNPGKSSLVEHSFEMECWDGGPVFKGFIDFADVLSPMKDVNNKTYKLYHVLDYKTRGDLRYAKKPEELRKDTQMVSYSRAVMQEFGAEFVKAEHLYVCTSSPYRTLDVSVTLAKHEVDERWKTIIDTVRQMEAWRAEKHLTADALPPNTNACDAFGGCAFRKLCGLEPSKKQLVQIRAADEARKAELRAARQGENMTKPMTLSEKIAAKNAAKANGTPATPAPNAMDAGLTPPDQPTQDVSAAPEAPTEQPVSDKKHVERKRKPRASSAAASLLSQMGDEASESPETALAAPPSPVSQPPSVAEPLATPAAPSAANSVSGNDHTSVGSGGSGPATSLPRLKPFFIYVDCMPTKGSEGDVVLFEDWIVQSCVEVAVQHGVADYRFIDFGKWKAPMVASVRQRVADGDLPLVMVFSSYAPAASEVLGDLVPYATRVVRALRG